MTAQQPSRTRNAEHTRQALLQAAAEVFAEAGFAGARVDDIARKAGYNKSLIFQYFTDKEGLYSVVVDKMRETSDHRYYENVRPDQYLEGDLTRERLEEFIDRSLEWVFSDWLTDPQKLKLITWEMAEGHPIFQLPDRPISGTRNACLVLAKAIQQGYIHSAMDPVMLVKTMMGLPLIYLTSVDRTLPREQHLTMLKHMCEKVRIILYSGIFLQGADGQ
ncbi:TetR/AcrR family transcriptional regulator [Deinococcus roseus]|uniref:TetR family transcriptional regulator n=1 Tax=Deinococcus roseus TaxID=392414 RepID=A0ABQ2CYU3_9DEIO|nr:TetR/AcrR family transcriptional regulator [Deinococcus roseus]GGJ34421.1 TetR family transcriptional regulator [Deinococcus roseus]